MCKLIACICIVTLLTSCGGNSSTPSIDGKWNEVYSFPGNSLNFTLSTQNTAVSGTGSYVGEAGPQGNLTVTGTYQPPSVNLSILYDNGVTYTFVGTVPDSNHMNGQMTYSSSTPTAVSFVR